MKSLINENNSWFSILNKEFNMDYFHDLQFFINHEYKSKNIFPPRPDIFKAFLLCPFDSIKVVILGQDPYHEKGQACGLAFSVTHNIKIPPSLKNIFKEWSCDKNMEIPDHGDLSTWAKNGVLLLNTTLTVEEGKAGSHRNKGWEIFTDHIIESINNLPSKVVFILWGKDAQSKSKFITNENHLIIKGPHPSPLSAYRGFFGGHYFSLAEKYLNEDIFTQL